MHLRLLSGIVAILIVGTITSAVRADDREDLRRLLSRPGDVIDSIQVAQGWAVVSSHSRDSGGYAILRKLGGRWQSIHGSGGAVSAEHLYLLGVPRSAFAALMGRKPSAEELQRVEEEARAPHWDRLSTSDCTAGELQGETWWVLTIMRNELYAKHGRPFKDPLLRSYFESRPWYRVNPAYHDGLLTARERRNVQIILDYQQRHGLLK